MPDNIDMSLLFELYKKIVKIIPLALGHYVNFLV